MALEFIGPRIVVNLAAIGPPDHGGGGASDARRARETGMTAAQLMPQPGPAKPAQVIYNLSTAACAEGSGPSFLSVQWPGLQTRSPKSEARKKSERSPKSEIRSARRRGHTVPLNDTAPAASGGTVAQQEIRPRPAAGRKGPGNARPWAFGLRVSDFFRISDFVSGHLAFPLTTASIRSLGSALHLRRLARSGFLS